jgi:hypothetical protein
MYVIGGAPLTQMAMLNVPGASQSVPDYLSFYPSTFLTTVRMYFHTSMYDVLKL